MTQSHTPTPYKAKTKTEQSMLRSLEQTGSIHVPNSPAYGQLKQRMAQRMVDAGLIETAFGNQHGDRYKRYVKKGLATPQELKQHLAKWDL